MDIQLFINHDHSEITGSGRDVPCTGTNTVGRCHPGSGIPFTGNHLNPGFQFTGGIQIQCTCFGQCTGIISGGQDFRQHGKQIQSGQAVEFMNHPGIKLPGAAVNGEHTAGFADTHHLFTAETIMHITGKSCDVVNVRDMRFLAQNSLIKMCNRPALRNVKTKFRCKLLCSMSRDRVAPGAEFTKLIIVFVKGQVAVHHC